jgi:hypothetical protein
MVKFSLQELIIQAFLSPPFVLTQKDNSAVFHSVTNVTQMCACVYVWMYTQQLETGHNFTSALC